jgi:hypothetical protein
LQEHDLYQKQLDSAERILKSMGRLQILERNLLPNYQFNPDDVVVVIGQDGLVANTLKYLDGQPVIAVNPDPDRWDGKLLPFHIEGLSAAVTGCLKDALPSRKITFAEAQTNDGQKLLAVNDLFIGPGTHTSARYKLSWGNETEFQSSSGVIVSTGLGSSGWFQSILAGAMGVTGLVSHPLGSGFDWSAEKLVFAVREPFPSQTTGTSLVFGEVNASHSLVLESRMPENGVVFSDGIEADFIQFNSGCIVTVGLSERTGRLMIAG